MKKPYLQIGVVMRNITDYHADTSLLGEAGWRIHPIGDDNPDSKTEALAQAGIVSGGHDVLDFAKALQIARSAIQTFQKLFNFSKKRSRACAMQKINGREEKSPQ